MQKIITRRGNLKDLDRIIFITKLAYKIPYRENTLVTKSHEPPDISEQFRQKKFQAIITLVNGKIIGAVRYKFAGNNLYFYKLAVLKSFRRQGIGSSLVAEAEKIARKRKCAKILLDCAREKKLDVYYKKFGYKIDKIKKHLDHHDVYMSKRVI